MKNSHTLLLMIIAFVMGLVCQYMNTVTYGAPNLPEPTIKRGQILRESAFFDDSYISSLVYSPRYPVRTCHTNMTYIDFSSIFSIKETSRVNKCILDHEEDMANGHIQEAAKQTLRWSDHTYLDSGSFVIEAGGHKGLDASQFNSRYHPGTYIVLEPVAKFFHVLKNRFKSSPNVVIYNFGIDVADGVFYVNEEKNDGASLFVKDQKKKGTFKGAKIVSVSKFFETLSVKSNEVDLITLNCEGCEFAVLDLLLSTDYIRHFRNIQFQPHKHSRICYPVKRFCWYQELLQKTHSLKFQFKFIWESWSRR
ncbi:uncharacterized protein LOC117317265 [Pecten maximus]|uniref:uncharacterized protein LOC117317265 n=1 Tax=Pecten maximus TaxID=6579 RepID=UPI0014587793|nr:uncharacterized protein LOC117317265 [Pecten maximus]